VMRIIWQFLGCFLGFSSLLTAKAEQPFALITIPKSGSHLTIKALYFMTGASPVWHTHFPSTYYLLPDYGFLYTHFCLSPELESNYADLPKLKKIINVRDLRDVCVSMVHQIEKNYWPGMTLSQRREFKQMSFEEKLSFVIDFDYDVQAVAEFAPNSLQVSMRQVAEQAVAYSKHPDYLVSKYEDLVGPLGGGSEESQYKELVRIAEYLDICMNEVELQQIAESLYGNEVNPFDQFDSSHFRSTFHSGKIGAWRSVFTEEHKESFKRKLGYSLIALGYEQDDSW
jgi:hypothetical protein